MRAAEKETCRDRETGMEKRERERERRRKRESERMTGARGRAHDEPLQSMNAWVCACSCVWTRCHCLVSEILNLSRPNCEKGKTVKKPSPREYCSSLVPTLFFAYLCCLIPRYYLIFDRQINCLNPGMSFEIGGWEMASYPVLRC
jgi:hypothetical protein